MVHTLVLLQSAAHVRLAANPKSYKICRITHAISSGSSANHSDFARRHVAFVTISFYLQKQFFPGTPLVSLSLKNSSPKSKKKLRNRVLHFFNFLDYPTVYCPHFVFYFLLVMVLTFGKPYSKGEIVNTPSPEGRAESLGRYVVKSVSLSA